MDTSFKQMDSEWMLLRKILERLNQISGGGTVSGPIINSGFTFDGPALLGRYDPGSGSLQAIQIGAGLSLAGDTLQATGGGSGDVIGPVASTDQNIAIFDGATGKLIDDGGYSIADVLNRANHTGTQSWATITSTPTTLAGYGITDAQPLDADLTAIAALTTTAYGRGFLPLVDAAAARTYIGAGTGSGSVTSVGISLPSIFSVSGSPVTTSGTLTAALVSQSANLVFAGPSTGVPAAPVFRSLVAADIPDLGLVYQPLDADLTAIAALSGTGFAVRTAANTWTQRSLVAPAAGITIADNAGVAGNPTFALANDLAALEGLATTGYARRTGADAWTLDATIPWGSVSSTPTTLAGYGITDAQPLDAALTALAAGSDFVQFTGPTTSIKAFALPDASATILTTNAAVTVAQGGTGATTLTGLLQGNGTSAFTAITNSSTVGQVLRVTGASTYAWGALDLADTDARTGTLPVGNGGTGFASYASGDLIYGNGGGTLSKLAEPGLPGYVLSASGGVPVWTALSTIGVTALTGTANQVLVNGTSGAATTGSITLTLPQSIATSSSVQFAELGLGRAAETGIPLSIQGGASTLAFLTGYGSTSALFPTISLRSAAGTSGSPTASQSGDGLGGFNMRGYGATGFAGSSRAGIFAYATENWTDSVQGAKLSFETTPNSTATRRRVLDIDQNADVLMTVGAFDYQGDTSQSGRGLFIQRDSSNAQINMLALGSGRSSTYEGIIAGGSFGSVTATPSGSAVRWRSRFYDGTTWFISSGISINTLELQSSSARGSDIRFDTILTGATSGAERMRISGAGNLLVGTTSDTGLTGAGNIKALGIDSTPIGATTPSTVVCTTLTTAAPSGSTANTLKVGAYTADGSAPVVTGYVIMEIGGTNRKVAVIS